MLRHWPVSDEKIGLDYKAKRCWKARAWLKDARTSIGTARLPQEQLRTVVNRPLPASLNAILGEMGELPRNGDDLAPFLWLDQKYYLA